MFFQADISTKWKEMNVNIHRERENKDIPQKSQHWYCTMYSQVRRGFGRVKQLNLHGHWIIVEILRELCEHIMSLWAVLNTNAMRTQSTNFHNDPFLFSRTTLTCSGLNVDVGICSMMIIMVSIIIMKFNTDICLKFVMYVMGTVYRYQISFPLVLWTWSLMMNTK